MEIDPVFLQTYSVSPCRPVNEGYVYFFRREFGVCQGPNIQNKINDQTSGQIKKKTPFVNGLTGAHKARVQNSEYISHKRRGLDSDSQPSYGIQPEL